EYSGKRKIYGFHGDVNGSIDESRVYKLEDDNTATEVIAEQDKTSENANKGRG
ncbi:urease subunit beta, partial [Staphylococcus ureilyticus]